MSLLVTNLGGGQTDAALSIQHFGAILTGSGVLTPTSFSVSAQLSPDMSVLVSGSDNDDKAVIITGSGDTYFIKNTTNENVTILANTSGVTKTDAIVLYVELTDGDPDNAGSPGAAKVIAVRRDGTSTGAPTDGEIDAATNNNPWLKFREVTVEHNTGEIESGDLSYERVQAQVQGSRLKDASVTADKIASEAWISFTPTWTASGSTPSIGNGTLTGSYIKIGRTVFANIRIKMGSTTTYGSGDWIFSLPVAPATLNDFSRPCGTMDAEDAGVKGYIGTTVIAASNASATYANKMVCKIHDAATNGAALNVNATRPFTWGSGDFMSFTTTYEAAT